MSKRVLIVGAGVCGMTLGYKLVQAGHQVTLIEKHDAVGGLARTYLYNGFSFDSGPHRFFSSNQDVILFLQDIFKNDLLSFPMKSSVYFLGKYFDWPISMKVILKLPPKLVVLVFFDLVANIFKKAKNNPQNFKEYILQKYGKTLYRLDFGPYTEKFTKVPNTNIHPDWAKAGVNRAVIKEDLKMNSLVDLIKAALKPPVPLQIFYPKHGISEFHRRLEDTIVRNGGEILLNCTVDEFQVSEQRITEVRLSSEQENRTYDTIVWTAPIHEASDLLSMRRSDLDYLHIVIFNICLRGAPKRDYQWIYYVDEDIVFNRLYNTVLFSQLKAPHEHYGLCVEVTCSTEDTVWKDPASLSQRVIDDLIKVKLIQSQEDVLCLHPERLENAYPIYKTNYRKELKQNIDNLYEIHNLILAGRTGLFWYNNMDHSIENAFQVAESIQSGQRETKIIEFWE